jgi:hypothetical protein
VTYLAKIVIKPGFPSLTEYVTVIPNVSTKPSLTSCTYQRSFPPTFRLRIRQYFTRQARDSSCPPVFILWVEHQRQDQTAIMKGPIRIVRYLIKRLLLAFYGA